MCSGMLLEASLWCKNVIHTYQQDEISFISSTGASNFNYSVEIFPFLKQKLTSNTQILAHKLLI